MTTVVESMNDVRELPCAIVRKSPYGDFSWVVYSTRAMETGIAPSKVTADRDALAAVERVR